MDEQMPVMEPEDPGIYLGVMERIVLLSILPKEGDYTTLKLMREMREDLSFTEEEHKQLAFEQAGGQVRWNADNAAKLGKAFRFGEKQKEIIAAALKRLDEQKKLQDEHFTLYEKFVVRQ